VIDFSLNSIRVGGANAFAQALKVNAVLRKIDLIGCSIEEEEEEEEQVKSFAEALKVNSALKKINLAQNRIGDEGTKSVSEALMVNSSLQDIDLQHNRIGDTGAKSVAEVIEVNSTLQNIKLSSNGIGDESANSIAKTLMVNSALQGINLAFNGIGDEGAKSFVEALKVNSLLQRCSIIQIGEIIQRGDFSSQIYEMLRENCSRRKINLCKFLCAFTAYQSDSVRLRCDDIILRFMYFPILKMNDELALFAETEELWFLTCFGSIWNDEKSDRLFSF
jgi:hypothetical protein